jgi:hypothetical protein
MKSTIITIALFLFAFFLTYTWGAYLTLDLNPLEWSQESRALQLWSTLIIGLLFNLFFHVVE